QAPATQPAKPAVAPQPAKPAQPAAASKPEPAKKPAAPVQEPAPQGLLDQVLANPMLLGAIGGGALLVLLIGLMVLSRRNAMTEAELQESLSLDAGNDSFAGDMELPDDSFAGLGDAADETLVREQAEERV